MRGDVSSQFLTALLMALPLRAASRHAIEVDGELISKPYVEITLNLLRALRRRRCERDGWQRFTMPAGARYRSPGAIHVEGDASSASLLPRRRRDRAAAPVRVEGVGRDSIQGDMRFVEALERDGREGRACGDELARSARGARPLKAIDLDCNHIPDAAMTLAVLALFADGPSTLRNIASWRVKETDRIAAMATELRKLGATVEEGADYLRDHAAGRAGAGAAIDTYDDHRMAMCFSLASRSARRAGAHQRPAVRRQDLPRLLRGARLAIAATDARSR